ncbi:Glycerol-3-phosphate 2-O-acyltransferase 4 [Platanthera guangdongensis]|uniref:Glycerol-3-phosphate 2-O-acyltransferase 4 n=1 Tax=Platanthera guangdongensis TaxID=2320717 RepID=A0ABR2M0B3_9ASPA
MVHLKLSFRSSPTADSCSRVCLFPFAVVSSISFPHFFLLAVEAGSLLCGAAHLLCPIIFIVYKFFFRRARHPDHDLRRRRRHPDFRQQARVCAVLLRFYLADVRADSYRNFRACRWRRAVVKANQAVMVEPIVKVYLGGDLVLGTELEALLSNILRAR